MLILLGIDSEFGTLEALIAPFYDMKWVKFRKEFFTGGVAVVMLIIGIGFTQPSGYYAFQLFDDYSLGLPLLFIAFFQVIAVSWVYGNDKFANDIEFMTGSRPNIFWMICWKYISPLAIFVIFIANCVKQGSSTYTYTAYVGCLLDPFSSKHPGTEESTAKVEYPGWGVFIAVFFTIVSMVPIIIWLVKDLVKNPSKWGAAFRKKFTDPIEYHPDPARADPSRRKTINEVQMDILKEFEKAAATEA